jgi:hypothetical protein
MAIENFQGSPWSKRGKKKWRANNFGLTWLTRMIHQDLFFIKIKEKKKVF